VLYAQRKVGKSHPILDVATWRKRENPSKRKSGFYLRLRWGEKKEPPNCPQRRFLRALFGEADDQRKEKRGERLY